MNVSILRKCLAELNEDKPSLDYVRGIIETLIELEDPTPTELPAKFPIDNSKYNHLPNHAKPSVEDEGSIMTKEARARIKNVDLNAIKTT